MSGLEVTVQGLPKLLDRFRTLDFMGRGAREFLRDWSDQVKHQAQDTIPVFTGDARNSIETDMDNSRFPQWAKAYSNDPKVRWLDYGTGALSEDPQSAHHTYFPPPENLADWASSKGLDPYAVASRIFARGGTPPTRFFRNAIEEANRNLSSGLQRFGRNIEFDASH